MSYIDELISIVVPVYNASRFIRQTIESIFAQTAKNWELILIDDCSTDDSYAIIQEYASEQVHVYRMSENSGQAKVRNLGRTYAKGRYLAYLDADDLWRADKLEHQYAFMRQGNYGFTFTGYEFAGIDGIGNGKIVRVPKEINYKQALKNTTISTITVMFDRTQIAEELLDMPSGVRGEDTATWWQILRAGHLAYGLDEALSVYRRYGQSHSSNKLYAVWGTYKMYRSCEHFSVIKSWYYFLQYLYHAVRRRM